MWWIVLVPYTPGNRLLLDWLMALSATRSVDVCVVCQQGKKIAGWFSVPPSAARTWESRNAYVPNTAKSSVTYQHLVRGVLRGTSFRNLTRGNSTHCMTVNLDSWTTTVNVLPSMDTPTAHLMIHNRQCSSCSKYHRSSLSYNVPVWKRSKKSSTSKDTQLASYLYDIQYW